MKKAVFDSSLKLVISIIIISFILTIGYFEINSFLENRNTQLFSNSIIELENNINYLIESNAIGSFLQTRLVLPKNQTIIFDNNSNNIILIGRINNNISLSIDLINELIINDSGNYDITLCYKCNTSKKYLVEIQ